MSDIFETPLSFEEIREKSEKYLLATYKRQPVAFFFGQDSYLYDTNQKQYIDFISGIAVTSLGHGEADITEAIRDQADRLLHTSNLFYNQEQALLAEVLIEHSFPGKVFFCNSGTEANEAAFKLARSYGTQKKSGARRILTLQNSFHGRSTAGMSLTGQERIHSGFGPLIDEVRYLPPNDIEMLTKEIEEGGDSICALFLELVQGEGGVRPLSKEYLIAARELTHEYGILLIFDEIQTGIGRLGTLFGFEKFGITPDAFTLAKALGSGVPIGAMVVAEDYTSCLTAGQHGSTFGGNHLAARVAFETIRVIITREILPHAEALSEYLFRRIRLLSEQRPELIRDVRGIGLLIGVELDRPGQPIVDQCREAGLLINCTTERTLRLLPPLNLSLEVADEACRILESVLLAQ